MCVEYVRVCVCLCGRVYMFIYIQVNVFAVYGRVQSVLICLVSECCNCILFSDVSSRQVSLTILIIILITVQKIAVNQTLGIVL